MAREMEISGAAFLEHLEDLGILRENSPTQRVIIDAPYDDVIKVYIQDLGTTRLLEMQAPDVTEMQVVRVGKDGANESRRYFSTDDYCHDCKVAIEWTDDSHRKQGHHCLSDSLKESDGAA